jgi:hypothetical protein
MEATFPLRHPVWMLPNTSADRFCTEHIAELYLHGHPRRAVRSLSLLIPAKLFRIAAEFFNAVGLGGLI